jgi:hypothetical protein
MGTTFKKNWNIQSLLSRILSKIRKGILSYSIRSAGFIWNTGLNIENENIISVLWSRIILMLPRIRLISFCLYTSAKFKGHYSGSGFSKENYTTPYGSLRSRIRILLRKTKPYVLCLMARHYFCRLLKKHAFWCNILYRKKFLCIFVFIVYYSTGLRRKSRLKIKTWLIIC